MKISEYRRTAGAYLKGRYGEAFVVTAIFLFTFVSIRAAGTILSYFFAGWGASPIVEAAEGVICFSAATPLMTGGFWWFYQTACEKDNRNLLKLYSGVRLNCRAFLLYALMWIKSFLSIFPTAACWTGSYFLIYGKTSLDSAVSLFAAFQLFMIGTAFLMFYFSTAASMALAPFIFISLPARNPFSVIISSSKLMKGKKLQFIKLMSSYIPAMLPVITIPFVMPSAVMSAAVFAKYNLNDAESVS